jgi:hypothetical protein
MNKKLIYLFIFVLTLFFLKEALANTDILCNVLTSVNGFLKEAGEVQNKISGKTRNILSKKVSPDFNKSKKLKDRADKLKKKAENLKSKAEKVKKFAEGSAEKKEELMAKYNSLNSLAAERLAQAKAIYDEIDAANEEYVAKYKESMGIALESEVTFQDNVQEGIKMVKNAETGDVKNTEESADLEQEANKEIPNIIKPYTERSPISLKASVNQTIISDSFTNKGQLSEVSVNQINKTPIENHATKISKILGMTDKPVEQNGEQFNIPDADILKESKINISSDEILNKAVMPKESFKELDLKTDIAIIDQLSGNMDKKLIKDIKSDTPSLTEDLKNAEVRKKFEAPDVSGANNIKSNKVKMLKKMTPKEKINVK